MHLAISGDKALSSAGEAAGSHVYLSGQKLENRNVDLFHDNDNTNGFVFFPNLDRGTSATDPICKNQPRLKSHKHPKLQSLQLHPQVTAPAGVTDLEGQHNCGVKCVFQDELGMCERCKAGLLHCRPEM